jgi:hypothetical protein
MYRTAANEVSGRIESGHFMLASSTPQEAVGELRTAGAVYVNESKVPAQTTIFPGDTLRTGAGGSATIEVPGKGMLLILQQTQISFGGPGTYFAEVKQGGVNLRSLGGVENFELQMGNVVVTPDPAAEAGAEIRRAADGSAQVKATLGSVGLVSLRGQETVFIKAGQEMGISAEGRLASSAPPLQPLSTPQAAEKPTVIKKKSRTPWIVLGAGGGAGAAIAAVLAGGGGQKPVSPSAP